ncbi:hypothetical protein C8J27_102131 [Rhodobacter aestuarii]|uniref:DUF6455 domain-containing protein n=1 Tax=Rhodobacter aestuarii TaxID=453582 RepID=A0A1N7NAC7_9RHOB|nr:MULTISPECIES: DUF6455 family protein [Rhodobacter]PTV96337.1 hypothetical protein C8J27_102131 [Rhodobacter aestuarii]SIS95314.1 hypothetical protein SAMN05421580_107131 [Rhodobacter aestuarii]SOB92804.1 hypothetical protein SAMN05877809_101602 [Rhodobacter sp. JA431]
MGAQGNLDLHFWITRGMARRLGVNLTEAMHDGNLTQADFASMITRCRECPGVDGCMAYLAGSSPAAGETPDWCRNRAILHELSDLTVH